MAGFDRSKWKAAPLATVNSTVNETKKFDTYFESGNNEYARFWTNRDGITIKRVLPAHEPGDSPYVPMLTAMLKIEVDDKDSNGTVIGKKVANKKIFIGTLHGGYPYDIIEEYIKRVYEKADAYQGDERDRYLNPVKGYRMGGKNGTWVPGIRPQLEYVFYALIEGKIYRDSLKPKQMEALNKESADLCAQNDTAAIDMFSDPTTGFPIQWSVGKDKDGKKETTLKSLPLKMQQTWDEYFGENAVPDAILEQLEKLPSLKSLYVDSYKKRDFDLALEGLKRFDEANVYKIFADEEFLDMVEQMAEMVAEKTGDDGKPSGTDDLPFGNEAPSAAPAPAAKKTPVAKAPAAKKAVAKKKPAEPTPEEKLAVINTEFVRQYGDGYDEFTLEDMGDELEETYQLALKKEDLGYDIPHVDGWDGDGDNGEDETPAEDPEPEQAPAAPEIHTAVGPAAVKAPADANGKSAMSAVERIRLLREQKAAAAKK